MIYQGHYTAIKFTSSHTSSVNSLCISGKIDEEIQFCARNVVQVSKGSVAVIHIPTGLIIYDQAIYPSLQVMDELLRDFSFINHE